MNTRRPFSRATRDRLEAEESDSDDYWGAFESGELDEEGLDSAAQAADKILVVPANRTFSRATWKDFLWPGKPHRWRSFVLWLTLRFTEPRIELVYREFDATTSLADRRNLFLIVLLLRFVFAWVPLRTPPDARPFLVPAKAVVQFLLILVPLGLASLFVLIARGKRRGSDAFRRCAKHSRVLTAVGINIQTLLSFILLLLQELCTRDCLEADPERTLWDCYGVVLPFAETVRIEPEDFTEEGGPRAMIFICVQFLLMLYGRLNYLETLVSVMVAAILPFACLALRIYLTGDTGLWPVFRVISGYLSVLVLFMLFISRMLDNSRRDAWCHMITVAYLSKRRRREHHDKDFVAVLAHELNTPLQVNLSSLELAAKNIGLVSRGRRKTALSPLTAARDSIVMVQSTINSYLFAQQIRADGFRLAVCWAPTTSVLSECGSEVIRLGEAQGVSVRMVLRAGCPRHLYCDVNKARHGVWILCSNALKYTKTGEILVELLPSEESKELIEVRVSDTGPGLPKGSEDLVFAKYVRGTVYSRTEDGLGVGLWVLRQLAELWGGRAWGHKREDGVRGSVFHFTFPVLMDGDVFDTAEIAPSRRRRKSKFKKDKWIQPTNAFIGFESESEDSMSASEVELNTQHMSHSLHEDSDEEGSNDGIILVVEDNTIVRRLFVRVLATVLQEVRSNVKLAIAEAADGQQGLNFFMENSSQVGLIFMDVQMPVMDGNEACDKIREFEREHCDGKPRCPLIFATAQNQIEFLSSEKDADYDGILGKPISRERLLDCVQQVFTSTSAGADATNGN